MTRLEYIRQFPGMENISANDAGCPHNYRLDQENLECPRTDSQLCDCGKCMDVEATIGGEPAPYLFSCPVKPGQTVYIPYMSVIYGENCGINKEKVGTITFFEDSWYAHFANNLGGFNEAIWMVEVFPTYEEAEAKLAEICGKDGAVRT